MTQYTDESGHILPHFDNISTALPPNDHEWIGDWKLCVEIKNNQTDNDGWSYAMNFSNLSKGNN